MSYGEIDGRVLYSFLKKIGSLAMFAAILGASPHHGIKGKGPWRWVEFGGRGHTARCIARDRADQNPALERLSAG